MEEKSSKCLTVIPPNIEKWEEKEECSLRGNSGISTVSIPFEKGRRDRTRGREKQNYQAFKLGAERERKSFSPRRSPGRPPDSCQINIFVEE